MRILSPPKWKSSVPSDSNIGWTNVGPTSGRHFCFGKFVRMDVMMIQLMISSERHVWRVESYKMCTFLAARRDNNDRSYYVKTTSQYRVVFIMTLSLRHIEGILPKGPHPPCLRMADRALLAGYPRYVRRVSVLETHGLPSMKYIPWNIRTALLCFVLLWLYYQFFGFVWYIYLP